MAATDKIFQGEDKQFEVTLVAANSVAIDLDTLAGIVFFIFDENETVIAKYSENAATGFDTLTVSDAPNGKFTVKLQSAITTTANPGFLKGEVKEEVLDATYTSSSLHTIAVIDDLAELKIAVSTAARDLT